MFQDGIKKHFVIDTSSCEIAMAQITIKYRRYNTPKGPHPPAPFLATQTDDDPLYSTAPSPQVDQEIYCKTGTAFLCLHFSNFRYSLTLFSKFFASFPHGTCALSVSHQYLALDGIYHPLCAAIPNNTTQLCKLQSTVERETHPLCCPVPRDFDQAISQTHHNTSV